MADTSQVFLGGNPIYREHSQRIYKPKGGFIGNLGT